MSRIKFVTFGLLPLTGLLVAGEFVCRVNYFLDHDYDWNYMTAPFRVQDTRQLKFGLFMPPSEPPTAPSDQMNITWHRPCKDFEVFSESSQRMSPYTYDGYCLRGDRVTIDKSPDEYRLFALGGSTVEDNQPDGDTMVDYLKRSLPSTLADKRVVAVNAGHSAYGSAEILDLYEQKVALFSPDLVLYHEAWNEQSGSMHAWVVDQRISEIGNAFHNAVHYKSMLYTYLVEKYFFTTVEKSPLWKIDVDRLSSNFAALAESVSASNARFILVTQPIRLPRYHRGVDTFDFDQVDRLLDSLQHDPMYVYDTYEISSLNQRLAVAREVQLAKELGIPMGMSRPLLKFDGGSGEILRDVRL